jgi:hypothetical protein
MGRCGKAHSSYFHEEQSAMTYEYTYDECSGYDCMTGGFRVSGPDGSFVIDQRDFGQKNCDYADTASREKAEAFTRKVVDALNRAYSSCERSEGG